jgi:hypothetical protein
MMMLSLVKLTFASTAPEELGFLQSGDVFFPFSGQDENIEWQEMGTLRRLTEGDGKPVETPVETNPVETEPVGTEPETKPDETKPDDSSSDNNDTWWARAQKTLPYKPTAVNHIAATVVTSAVAVGTYMFFFPQTVMVVTENPSISKINKTLAVSALVATGVTASYLLQEEEEKPKKGMSPVKLGGLGLLAGAAVWFALGMAMPQPQQTPEDAPQEAMEGQELGENEDEEANQEEPAEEDDKEVNAGHIDMN